MLYEVHVIQGKGHHGEIIKGKSLVLMDMQTGMTMEARGDVGKIPHASHLRSSVLTCVLSKEI